jgi:hypothetical protein
MSSEPQQVGSSSSNILRNLVGGAVIIGVTAGAGVLGQITGSLCNAQWNGGPPFLVANPVGETSAPSCTGAEIGFGVGFGAAAFLLTTVGLFCTRMMRCSRASNSASPTEASPLVQDKTSPSAGL